MRRATHSWHGAGRARSKPERPADDLLHDLGGPAVDARDARVDVGARDRILLHVAVAAVQLQTAVDHPTLELGAPPLRHRRLLWRELTGCGSGDATIHIGLGDLDLRVQFGE